MHLRLLQKYFPAFSTREAELRAYSELPGTILDRIVPVVTLTREREAPSLEASLAAVVAVANGRPIIVDFDPVRRYRVFAHSLEITDQELRAQERGQLIPPIVVGNERDILAITLPLVIDLNRLMRDFQVEFDSTRDVWSVYAEDYWLRFSGRPKRRRRSGQEETGRATMRLWRRCRVAVVFTTTAPWHDASVDGMRIRQ